MDDAKRQRLQSLAGFILLIKKPGDPKLYGPVENSWSLSVEPGRTQFFWTSPEAKDNVLGLTWKVDGRKDVEASLAYWKGLYPDWDFTIYDARDAEALPVVLNWDLWLDAHEPSDKTFSGIKNKHEARNLRFTLKGQPSVSQPTTAVELVGTITTLTKENA